MVSASSSASSQLHWALDGPGDQANDNLAPVERRMLKTGKKEHRETTQATQRTLQVAEQTVEMASATVLEVKRQGNVLEKTDRSIETVEKDVHEASRVMKFMRRWCCFQVLCCCDCFDPDVDMDKTRMRRLKERKQEEAVFDEGQEARRFSHQAFVTKLATKTDAAYNGNQAAARSELFAKAPGKADSYDDASGLGYGLPETDRLDLKQETQIQDQNIDRIGSAVDTLRVMSLELQEELQLQTPQIEGLGDRVHIVHDKLHDLSREVRRV